MASWYGTLVWRPGMTPCYGGLSVCPCTLLFADKALCSCLVDLLGEWSVVMSNTCLKPTAANWNTTTHKTTTCATSWEGVVGVLGVL